MLGDITVEMYKPPLVRWAFNANEFIKIHVCNKLILSGATKPVWEVKRSDERRSSITAIPENFDTTGGSSFAGWKTKILCLHDEMQNLVCSNVEIQSNIDELHAEKVSNLSKLRLLRSTLIDEISIDGSNNIPENILALTRLDLTPV